MPPRRLSLELISRAKPKIESGVYVAYNRAIAGDAKAKFPRNTQCATAHSFAFRAVGVKYKHRLNGPRVTAKQTAAILGVNGGVSFGDEHKFGPVKLALLAMGTVTQVLLLRRPAPSRQDTFHLYPVRSNSSTSLPRLSLHMPSRHGTT